MTLAYLDFLAAFPDSHIARKHGVAVAEKVRRKAAELAASSSDEVQLARELLAFDRQLKAEGLNPGTSADLAVASVLALSCAEMSA